MCEEKYEEKYDDDGENEPIEVVEMEEEKLTEKALRGFTGTEAYHRLSFIPLNCTDGVKYLAEKGNAFWLVDTIASYGRKEPFQIWELTVKDKKAILTMRETPESPVLVKQKIDYTDFPLPSVELYLVDGVLMLPSEY